MIEGIVTFNFGGRNRVANLITQEESGAWVETLAGTRLFVPAEDIVTPEKEQAQQQEAALERITRLWTDKEKYEADRLVGEYILRFNHRAHSPLPGEWVWRREQADAVNARVHDLAVVEGEFREHAEKRRLRWLEVDAWAKRQPFITDDGRGAGAVMVPLFEAWLKKLKKLMPTKKAQKDVLWLETAVTPPICLFSTVTLDFVDNRMTAYFWSVDKAGENAGYGLVAFKERLECRVDHPFTARVDFETLFDVVSEMSPERADFRLSADHFELWTEVNHNRLTLVPMHPATEAFWLGFKTVDDLFPSKSKAKRSRAPRPKA